jgi:hypothetical protein
MCTSSTNRQKIADRSSTDLSGRETISRVTGGMKVWVISSRMPPPV